MKYRLLLLLSVALRYYELNAQVVMELSTGLTCNYAKQKTPPFATAETIKPGIGYSFSSHVRLTELGFMSFKMGLQAATKRYTVYRSGIPLLDTRNLYIILPVIGQLRCARLGRFDVLGEVGVYAAFWMTRLAFGKVPNAFSGSFTVEDDGKVFQNLDIISYKIKNDFQYYENRFEYGGQIGLQLRYKYKPSISPFANISYQHAFVNNVDNKSLATPFRNRTLGISIGTLLSI